MTRVQLVTGMLRAACYRGRAQPEAEDVAEMIGQRRLDFRQFDCPAQQARQRRDPAISNPTWHDQIEIGEVSRHVQREPVARNPSRDAHADRPELVRADPDTGQAGHACRGNAEISGGPNHDFLEVANISVDIAAIRAKVDNWVTHDLPWTV